MIITTQNGKSFDTQKDLTAPERHVLQKLFLWQSMASSLQQFKEKTNEAFNKGWNNSGRIYQSPALKTIVHDLETKVIARLAESHVE
ncbi:MAG: hypothetical protein JW932_01055 [Deltaproteobacteria bacterium]|nr:hypothetical protein [Deltaproteobacteria bacterium]